jgi:UDP-N-acetylglucosamine enolpyruvyl transferase
LGKLGTPMFLLQEGTAAKVSQVFRQIAKLSGGAHLSFDLAGIGALRNLLGAIAVFATGGRTALENYAAKQGSGEVLRLTAQLRTPS